MTKDLELTGRPLLGTSRDAALFVDRESEVEAIEESLVARANVLMLSERGAGKTTLLRHVARRLERRDWRAVFVEGALATSPAELLSLVRARVFPSATVPPIGDQFGAALAAFQSLGKGYAVARRPQGAAGESQLLLDILHAFATDLEDDERRHVVLLDEVSSPEIVHTVFGRLRDELWQLPVVWVVAGDLRDRHVYLRPPADAFFSRIISLGPLDESTALKLLRRRIPRARASDGLLRTIVAQSSRLPRDLVRVATDVVIGGVRPEQLASSRAKRDDVLAALGEPAQRVVAELEAQGPASASDEDFLTRLGFGRSRAAQIFRELEQLGILEASVDRAGGQRPRKVYGLRQEQQ